MCTQTQMHSVSLLLSPGSTLNKGVIVGEGSSADGVGGGAIRDSRKDAKERESELVCMMQIHRRQNY